MHSLTFQSLGHFQHPASLNVLQQFGQACSILRNTTRASNPAWYQDALELDFQLHIRPDGPQISAFYYDRKQDHAGPQVLPFPRKSSRIPQNSNRSSRTSSATPARMAPPRSA
jgi:hypothetical protein